LNGDVLYKYILELNDQKVLKEYLGKKVERRFTRIFEYQRNQDDWDFKSPKLKINDNDLIRFKEKNNTSVLSSLIDTGYLKEIEFFSRGRTNVGQYGYSQEKNFEKFVKTSRLLHKNSELLTEVLSFIKNLDVGISGFEFADAIFEESDSEESEKVEAKLLECVHNLKNASFNLDLIEESDGTIHGISILAKVFPVLRNGGLIVLDEIDASLHPFVAKKIISLFENKRTNRNSAQLIFSTHQHLLLNDRTKTQIFLAQKGENLETEIFRLSEVEGVRNDDNFFQKYLAGVYGGVPNIFWF